MAKKVVTERARLALALNAAAYMRWVETRKGASPSQYDTHQYIRGLLDVEEFTYDANEPLMVELSALALDLDVVHAFIKKSRFFEMLDQATQR